MIFTRVTTFFNSARTLGSLVGVSMLFFAIHAQAGQVSLVWDASTPPNVVGGYQLFYGQASGNYTVNVDVGNQTSYTLTGLVDGVLYYFAVKAYDTTQTVESGFSNEVSQTIVASGGGSGGGGGGGTGGNIGLVAAYSFEEVSGTTVVDASGQGNNGVITGATQVTQGWFGKALAFDGVSDWVTVADASSLDLSTGMTLEAWVYPTDYMTGGRTVLLKERVSQWSGRTTGTVYSLYANSNTNQPSASVRIGYSNQNWFGGTQPAPNQWTHLAATYDGTTERLYINGSEVVNRQQSGSIQASSGVLRIGGNSIRGEFFKGLIDEVRIYNRALSASEIQTDMNTPVNTSSSP